MSPPDYRPSNRPAQEVAEIEQKKPSLRLGTYQPRAALSNEEIESWGVKKPSGEVLTAAGIEGLIGVKRRFVADESETPLFMGLEAVKATGQYSADVLLVSTSFPTGEDMASRMNDEFGLGAKDRVNFHMACSGFAAGLNYLFLQREKLQGARVLMVAAEKYHPHLQDLREPDALQKDPWLSQTIFSDGAAAMSFTLGEDLSILGAKNTHDFTPEQNAAIRMPIDYSGVAGGYALKRVPPSPNGIVLQDGHSVYEVMSRRIPQFAGDLVEGSGVPITEITGIMTHQGSKKITDIIERRLKGSLGQVGHDQEDGNVSSAAIPKLMKRQIEERRILANDTFVIVGFGAGLMASGAIVKFGRVA